MTQCPNCKGDAELHVVDGVEFIECKADQNCGWFETQADGGAVSCLPPIDLAKSEQPDEAEITAVPESESLTSAEPGKGGGAAICPQPPSEPAQSPDLDEDDEDGIEAEVSFDDD